MNKIYLLLSCTVLLAGCSLYDDRFVKPVREYDEHIINKPGVAEFRIRKYKNNKNNTIVVKNIGLEDINLPRFILYQFDDSIKNNPLPKFLSYHEKSNTQTLNLNDTTSFKLENTNPIFLSMAKFKLDILTLNGIENLLSGFYKGEVWFTRSDSLKQSIATFQGTIDYFGNIFFVLDNEEITGVIDGKVSQSGKLNAIGHGENFTNKWTITTDLNIGIQNDSLLIESKFKPIASTDSSYSATIRAAKIL